MSDATSDARTRPRASAIATSSVVSVGWIESRIEAIACLGVNISLSSRRLLSKSQAYGGLRANGPSWFHDQALGRVDRVLT